MKYRNLLSLALVASIVPSRSALDRDEREAQRRGGARGRARGQGSKDGGGGCQGGGGGGGRSRRGGRVALEVTLAERGIRFRHSRPYHPQTCGKVERFHQTVKKWLTRQPRAATIAQLQTQLDEFRDYYNTVRPHRALGRRTPIQAYLARPKAVPTGQPLDPGHYRVRHDKIDPIGVITLRHNSRLHHIGIGRRHAGTDVLVLVHDLHIRVLDNDGDLLRELTLDPSRDYQPQPKP